VTTEFDPSILEDKTEYDPLIIAKLGEAFEQECIDRHAMGAKKYGPVKFLTVDSFQEAMMELADLANYARYSWIKLALLSAQASQFEEALQAIRTSQDGQLPEGFVNPFRKQG
jgi:hypothetical protein